ncbi:hypothetical protein P43SY_009103 [Pythium insidiosum]|uniref:Uncharacterized protein n=1 Tax=Pythium insidiosum TaxID=114742 RepID=A0AAD5Q3F7_PYTIN|nr:hypothetical protein P43SY_009103 [Pythium insidiosum]
MHHAVEPSATAAASVEEIKTFRRASATSSALTTTTRLHVYCSNSLYVVWKLITCALHVGCTAYFVLAGLVYSFLPRTRLVWSLCTYTSTLHSSQFLARLLCILSDTVLDFVATIGVPVVLAVSYLRDFDWAVLDWKFERYYEDKWFVNYVRPWFVRDKACALIEINCHPFVPHHFTVGNLSEMTLVLGRLESYSLSQINIRHCRALEMPPSLDRYRQLLGIKLYNVSLALWSDDAALRNAFHPKMSYLFCVRTTFLNHTLPSGLTAVDYPQSTLYVAYKLSIYALHCGCTAYFLLAAYTYSYLPTTQLSWSLSTYTSTLDSSQFPAISRVHYVMATMFFAVLFLTREFVETGLQSYQAYQMTHQSPRLTLNRIFVALLVINCWSSSLVHLIVRDRALQRLLCILSDTILDFVATIGVPVVLAVSYLPDFDYTRLDWFYEKYYEDKWFVNYVIECPVVLLGSWFEVCARMTLSLSLLSSLNRMNKLVARRRLRAIGPVPSTLASTTPIHVPISTTLYTEQSAWGRWSQRVVTWGHRCLAVYGALVMVVHLHSEYGSSPAGCLIEVRPWFVRDKACALIEINCHPFVPHHFTVGNLSEMTHVLGRLESYSLSQINIRHCRALEMPPSLDRYRQLLGIKLYNVSLASWSDDAALRNAFHPKMSYLFCVRTTFLNHTLPSGLTAVDYPSKLLDVELIFTNVRSLPSDLDEKWPTDMVLYVEYGEFEQLPACLARLRAFQLHLTGNPLTSLDPAVLMSPGLDYLSLGFTKLTRLPDAIDPRAVKALRRLRLEHTNVSALPSWMNDDFGRPPKVFMAGTPLSIAPTMHLARSDTVSPHLKPEDRPLAGPKAVEASGAVRKALEVKGKDLSDPAAQDVSGEPNPPPGVDLAPVGRVLALLSLDLLHVICAGYFILAGILYRALPDKELAAFLDLYALALPSHNFRLIGNVHFVLAALHLASLAWHCLSNRRCRRRHRGQPVRPRSAAAPTPVRLVSHTLRAFEGVMDAVFGSHGLFGIESDHFDVLFLVRETVETLLQANQAYRMSRLVPRVGLNRFYIVVLVINCWMSPLVHHFVKRKSLQRLLCVLSDVLLDFVTAIGVPVVLTVTYIQGYDRERGNFPFSNWYNDVWVVNFMNESTIVLFGSWFDAFSRLIFSVSLLLCLEDARQLIKPRASSGISSSSGANARVAASMDRKVSSRLHSALRVASAISKSRRIQRIVRMGHNTIAFVGTVLALLHLHAAFKWTTKLCALEVNPWLTRRPACALLELSCRGLTSPPTLDGVLNDLDGPSLAHIVLRHCQDVNVPPQIQRFPNLLGIKMYNASVSAWPADAALEEEHHKMLRFAFFVRCEFPGHALPDGLISRQFPTMLRDLEFTITNLRALPSDLHTRWPEYIVFWVEYAELTEMPATLSSMVLWDLALTGNPISRVDAALLTRPGFHELGMSATNVTTLPELGVDSDSSLVSLEAIKLQYSNLSALPSWMDDAFLERCTVYAGATPLCRLIQEATVSNASADALDARYQRINCDEDGIDSVMYYPLFLEEDSEI